MLPADTLDPRPAWRRVLGLLVVGALTLAPRPGHAAPEAEQSLLTEPAAQAALDAGLEAFYAEDFEGASAAFADAYAIEPTPFLLYSWAQAERYAEHCDKAISLFERFLSTAPPGAEAAKARKSIVECGGIPPADVPTAEATPTVPPPQLVDTVPPEPTPPPAEDAEGSPPPRSNRVGLIVGLSLAAVGTLTSATGGIVLAGGRRMRSDAPGAATQQAYLDGLDRADQRQVAGAALIGVGAALLVSGVLTAVLTSRRR